MIDAPRPLIVDLARYYGGAEARVLALATALGPQGCGVACLVGSPLAERCRAVGLNPLELAAGKFSPHLPRALRSAASQGGFDLVDAHNVQSYLWSAAAFRSRPDRPALLATVHSSTRLEQRSRLKGGLYERAERLALPAFDGLVVVSTYLRQELQGWGLPADRLSVIPNGVRLDGLPAGDRQAVRQELGLRPADQVVGAVGRLEPAKGLVYLIEAAAQLAPQHPDLRVVIVGAGRLEGELHAAVRQHGLEQVVLFTGFRQDVTRCLQAFDLFALPSLTEGIPIALLEACASARPVVASRVGGVPEVIADGEQGLLVPPGDVPALAQAITRLLDDPQLATRLGEAARQRIAARYSLESMLDGTCQAYRAALEQRRRSSRGGAG